MDGCTWSRNRIERVCGRVLRNGRESQLYIQPSERCTYQEIVFVQGAVQK